MKRRRYQRWYTLSLLALLTLVLQGCLNFGGNSPTNNGNFQNQAGSGGTPVGINDKALFKGKLYFTLKRNLYVMDGKRNLTQLTKGIDVLDPAVSPDGKWIAFIARYKNYTDLMLMPAEGGEARVLRSGKGDYFDNPNSDSPYSTHNWYAQPAWNEDSKTLLFLSDLAKFTADPGVDTFLLDLQIFAISIDTPDAKPQEVGYAAFGTGGNRDPMYRPGHPDQIIYTHYQYDSDKIKQLTQIYLEDPNAIANSPPGTYRPGVPAIAVDPAVALTPPQPDLEILHPTFSPDGDYIAFARRISATQMSIEVMPMLEDAATILQTPNDPETSEKALAPFKESSQLLTGQYVSQPVWSPDGKQIAYINYTNNLFDIWLADVIVDPKTNKYQVKGTPIQLTDAKGQLNADSRPVWMPDAS